MRISARRIGMLGASAAAGLGLVLAGGSSAWAQTQSVDLVAATPDWFCGHTLTSNTVHLVFQCDGNLVLYRNSDNHAMWASGTGDGNMGPGNHVSRVNFHSDGTINLYGGVFFGVECTINEGAAAPYGHMSVQDDGNLVVYTDGGKAVWSSNTYNNMQGTTDECGK